MHLCFNFYLQPIKALCFVEGQEAPGQLCLHYKSSGFRKKITNTKNWRNFPGKGTMCLRAKLFKLLLKAPFLLPH